jgi:nucleotide-binding universal stress UspA family protein
MTLLQVASSYVSGSVSSEWYPPLQSTFDMVEQQAKAYLERMAGRLNEQGIATSIAVRTDSVAESIKYADTGQTDLIAMCTHGRTGLARWALGGVAGRVLRAAGIPILLVRPS